jgi:hypothetical protein
LSKTAEAPVTVRLVARPLVLDVAGSTVAGYPTRLLDVAAAHCLRSTARNSDDLDRAIATVEEARARDEVR